MKKLSTKIEETETHINSLTLIDYVIAIQLEKIENYQKDPRTKKITNESETAMKNMVELLKIRSSVANRINLFK
ncbi:MAG: hypothetical protein E7Z81_03375 [Methanobrevibacter sp.]|jgi:hypothetical protein|uniref:hypothetical protein n=1 Tax=Methanobrevibacter sp. TaxID=66852 RepID=UPI002426C143|nr:hypothetical protein [Methanobrevibacter sp.]MBE6141089.1 hypothetical protein [Bacillota bacterium]MBE6497305.1 hypothetical protein [Methanobrevibacter sp.]